MRETEEEMEIRVKNTAKQYDFMRNNPIKKIEEYLEKKDLRISDKAEYSNNEEVLLALLSIVKQHNSTLKISHQVLIRFIFTFNNLSYEINDILNGIDQSIFDLNNSKLSKSVFNSTIMKIKNKVNDARTDIEELSPFLDMADDIKKKLDDDTNG